MGLECTHLTRTLARAWNVRANTQNIQGEFPEFTCGAHVLNEPERTAVY